MTSSILQHIQGLQFTDRAAAEALLLGFLNETFGFGAVRVELRPLAVSLNSFNGFAHLHDGRVLFFKTHTESDTVINEYYQAGALAQAGYPIIQPIYSSTEVERQILVYERITAPSVFDYAWELECAGPDAPVPAAFAAAQHAADRALYDVYARTLAPQSADEAARAPVHQLFYHRLTGGRLDRFYNADVRVLLPVDDEPRAFAFSQVRAMRWTIGGRAYAHTLDALIAEAVGRLRPFAGASVLGHGDAHNGNVFWEADAVPPRMVYFDPAFAGRHHPLLDIVKPLFHNVFAMWMYFPQVKAANTPVRATVDGDTLHVRYDYPLPPVRHLFLESKCVHTLVPLLRLLDRSHMLPPDWRRVLKLALMCCPLLTLNLADQQRFPPAITLLGLAMAVEMGAPAVGGGISLIDAWIERAGHEAGI
jgi:hypothetical protein